MTAITTRGCSLNGSVQFSSSAHRVARLSQSRIASTLLLTGCCIFWAGSAAALDVNVTNYSWLQSPSAAVTPFIGSANNVTGTSFGAPADFRWGDYVWLPTDSMTASGTQSYYAGVRLDQPRQIEKVKLQWWTNGGNTATQYHIDGSNDGTSWTNLTTQPTGFVAVDRVVTEASVTPGMYQYVRVRFDGPDFVSGGTYGGPGFLLIDPIGSGPISGDKVNWANAQFGTTAVNTNMPTYNSTTYNDGTLEERAGTPVWTGTQFDWNTQSPNAYTTLSLGQARLIGDAIAVWGHPYSGNAFDIEYSTDGINFTGVTNRVLSNYATENSIGATESTFDPVIATHIRMRNASGNSAGFTLINQLLLHSPTDGVLSSDPGANSTLSFTGDADSPITTINDAVTLENTGVSGSAIGIFSYTITGLDAAEFDLTNFSQMILEQGDSFDFDLEFNSPVGAVYTALLTFNTSVGSISFNLEASPLPAPEPSTAVLLALGCLVPMMRRRRK